MSFFEIIAEQRIAEAIRRGDLDHLPGAGRPLELEDELFVIGEQRMVNRILKNAGMAPPEVELRRQIAALRAELEAEPDEAERERMRRRMGLLLIQLNEMRAR